MFLKKLLKLFKIEYPSTQCAAVITYLSLMRVAPQYKAPL